MAKRQAAKARGKSHATISIRFPATLKKRLEAVADREQRALSNMATVLIERGLVEMESGGITGLSMPSVARDAGAAALATAGA